MIHEFFTDVKLRVDVFEKNVYWNMLHTDGNNPMYFVFLPDYTWDAE